MAYKAAASATSKANVDFVEGPQSTKFRRDLGITILRGALIATNILVLMGLLMSLICIYSNI